MSNSAPIVAEALVRHFGDVRAVDGVDLEVQEGEIFGFLGPNGAGKSTTVRMLTTLLRPTGGPALVAGYDVVTAGTGHDAPQDHQERNQGRQGRRAGRIHDRDPKQSILFEQEKFGIEIVHQQGG